MEYLNKFFEKFDYPEEARTTLSEAYKKIKEPEFFQYIRSYEEGNLDYIEAIKSMNDIAEKSGVHQFTVKLLFVILLTEHLEKLYKQKGLSEKIFYDSMCDLKYKLLECHNLHGVWGTMTAPWFQRFFEVTRFALGRLQFELMDSWFDYDDDNMHIKANDHIINVHIPSAGKLLQEDCLDSYKQAYDFYKEYHRDGILYMYCHSWLLEPALEEILDENSNIIKFKRNYKVFRTDKRDVFPDAWRVFNKENVPIEELPENNSLQKRIKEYLLKGNTIGYGLGVMAFDGEKIIN